MAPSFLEKFTGMFKDRRIDVAERFELCQPLLGHVLPFRVPPDLAHW